MFIRTDLGAADEIARTAPFPEGPDNLSVSKPSDLRSFRKGVENEMQAPLLGLAAVSLVIGAVVGVYPAWRAGRVPPAVTLRA